MITEHKTVYRTEDGKLFVDAAEAAHHENVVLLQQKLTQLVDDTVRYANRAFCFGEFLRADSPAFKRTLVEGLIKAGVRFEQA